MINIVWKKGGGGTVFQILNWNSILKYYAQHLDCYIFFEKLVLARYQSMVNDIFWKLGMSTVMFYND